MKEHWEFPYAADVLTEAATKKLLHHTKRMNWWKTKQDEKLESIKTKGINVTESVAANSSLSFSTYNNNIGVSIDNVMLNELNECKNKVVEHQRKITDYEAWVDILSTQGKASFKLTHVDWLFFFSSK